MNKHPQLYYRFRHLVSSYSLVTLLGAYTTAIAVVALLLGSAVWLTERSVALPRLWLDEFLALFDYGPAPILSPIDQSGAVLSTVEVFNALISVLAPAVLLGVIVYKFFHVSKAVVFRTHAYLDTRVPDEPQLSIRFYNSTWFDLTQVSTQVYIRLYTEAAGVVDVENFHLAERVWGFGEPGTPFTTTVRLADRCYLDSSRGRLIIGRRDQPLPMRFDFLVVITGSAPDLNTSFTKTKVYTPPDDLTQDVPGQIALDVSTGPKSWAGWEEFDHGPAS